MLRRLCPSLATGSFVAALGILACFLPVAAAELATLDPRATARVLAGLEHLPPAYGAGMAVESANHARDSAAGWARYERTRGNPMREWARTALVQDPGEAVFYPFSGPDFPTVNHFYPDAGRYVLVSIQPAGPPPALERYAPRDREQFFARFRQAWAQYSHLGFFRTDDLNEDSKRSDVRIGVTAQLMAFAARLGYEVINVEPVRLSAVATDLEFHPGRRDEASTWDSVRLYLAKDARFVRLDYVRLDLSDTGLQRNPSAAAWIGRMAGHRAVLKAASHLLQKPHFAMLRDALLARAPAIVQDETGIDYADLAKVFDVRLYGGFTRTHPRFTSTSQGALAAAYRETRDVRPLPFAIGYRKESGSTVQVAVRHAPPPGGRSRAAEAPPNRAGAALQALVAARLADYAQRPRKVFLGGSPNEPAQAEYVAAVKTHIGRILATAGVAPAQPAVLSLTLASDGTLDAADLEKSSGNPQFDRRIRTLLHRGAPFPHWPEVLRAGADLLVITLHLPGT